MRLFLIRTTFNSFEFYLKILNFFLTDYGHQDVDPDTKEV